MHINLESLVVAYFVSLFVDWVFQWDWQASNKSKWGKKDNFFNSWWALFTHSLAYAFLTTVATFFILTSNMKWLYNDATPEIVTTLFTLLVSHMIIDSRIPVKWIMRFKGLTKEQIQDYTNFGFMHIGIDHRLHELVLLILSLVV